MSVEQIEEISPNLVGKVAVEVEHPSGQTVTIHVPEGHTDPTVRYELPSGEKGVWVNPDGVQPIVDPTPDDDVIWDATLGAYVPRIPKDVAEAGTAAEGVVTA